MTFFHKLKSKVSFGHLLLLVALLLPSLGISRYAMRVYVSSYINMMLTISLSMTMGLAGLVSFGHAGFFAVGAYSAAILNTTFGVPPALTLLAAGLLSAGLGWLVALTSVRVRGLYFALATMAFGEVVRLTLINWTSLTRGVMGIAGITRPSLLGASFTINQYYYLALLLVVIAYLVGTHLSRSDFGLACFSLRADDLAASCMGIDVFSMRTVAAALSAFGAGVAGAFYAHFYTFVSPAPFNMGLSLQIMVMAIVALVLSLSFRVRRVYLSAICVALAMTWLPELLRFMASYRMAFYGGLIVLVVLINPYLQRLGEALSSFNLHVFGSNLLKGGSGRRHAD